MWIFIHDDNPDNPQLRKLNATDFAQERVALGSKLFDCVKMTASNAERDSNLAKLAKKGKLVMAFVTRDYKVVKALADRGIDAGSMYKAMQVLAKKSYKSSFDKMVKGYVKILNQVDRLDGDRQKMERLKAKIAEAQGARRKKMERDLDKQEKAFEKAMLKLEKQEKALLELKPRGPVPAVEQPDAA